MNITTVFHGPQSHALFDTYAHEFSVHFGAHTPAVPVSGIAGRMLRGRKDSDFLSLTDNPDRKIVFLVDERTLNKLIGLTGREILETVGYPTDFINELLAKQTVFKIVIFSTQESKLADWNNLLDAVTQAYPDKAVAVERSRQALQTQTYEQLKAAGGTAWELRQFLEQTINVNQLFTGSGYVRQERDAKAGSDAEYVALNQPLVAFPNYCLISFPVE